MKRLSRSARAIETRKTVLDAASRLFRNKGFHGATLEQIADEAGFSTGVIYSQFGGKDELFLALIEQHAEAFSAKLRRCVRRSEGSDALETLWSTVRATRDADVSWGLTVIEFRVHAARNTELNRRYADLHRKTLGMAADVVAELVSKTGIDIRGAPEDIARFLAILDNGGLLERQVAGPGSAFDVSRRAAWLLLNHDDDECPGTDQM